MLFQVAYNTCNGDLESAARKILQDFRSGRMGPMALQVAPSLPREGVEGGSSLSEEEVGQVRVDVRRNVAILGETPRSIEEAAVEDRVMREERANAAVQKAKDKGLDLPPLVEGAMEKDDDEKENQEADIGKGLFDGW